MREGLGEASEAALLGQARAGDREALSELLERHQAGVFRFSLAMCRDPEDAKDVLQDTLLTAAQKLGDFRGEAALSTWLYTISRRLCARRRRQAARRAGEARSLAATTTRTEVASLPDPAEGPEAAVMKKELEAELNRAIDGLSPAYREVLVLRDVEGLSAPEVSEVLGLGVRAVKSRLHRARKMVRAALETDKGPEGDCPDVVRLFSLHLEGDLDERSCARMEEHLKTCARCQGRCDALKDTLAMCRRVGTRAEIPEAVKRSVRLALKGFLSAEG